jgi:elongation factor Ts
MVNTQLADSGKPADILEKIVNGRLRKFYEGVCLTEQPHMVEEGNPKVSKVLDQLGIEVKQFKAKSIS